MVIFIIGYDSSGWKHGTFLKDFISNQKIEINKLDLFIFKDNRNYPLKILFKFIRLHKKIKDTN